MNLSKRVFIGGSIGIDKLTNSMLAYIDSYVKDNYTILIGDAYGTDKLVQDYLFNINYQNVLVYCSGVKCRNNSGKWRVMFISSPNNLHGREFYTIKDKRMANDCNEGFMIWDGISIGTKSNIEFLLKLNKPCLTINKLD